MRRNNDEFINEILQRSENIIVQRKRRTKLVVSLVPAGLCVALLVMIRPGVRDGYPHLESESQSDMSNQSGMNQESNDVNDEGISDGNSEQESETEDYLEGEDGFEDTEAEDVTDGSNSDDEENVQSQMFRGMELLSIEDNVVKFVHPLTRKEITYLITEEGIIDESSGELLELSEEEQNVWDQIRIMLEEE